MKVNGNPLLGILIELDSIERRLRKVKKKLEKTVVAQLKAAKEENNAENKKDAN